MAIVEFPALKWANEDGLLAVGGDLEVESLLLAYRSGIFPWPIFDSNLITWFSPKKRAVLFLKDFHISRSLRAVRRRSSCSFAIDKDFAQVINECAKLDNRDKELGTWITPSIIDAYIALHSAGYAHSIECYEGEVLLVGGLYGVSIGSMFAGESMFFRRSGASKLSFCFLVDYLLEKGVEWIDCQQMTPLLKSFGAVEIDRDVFVDLLNDAANRQMELFSK